MKTWTRLLKLTALAAVIAAPASAQTATVPNESRVSGESVFRTYCASCHGATGRGDGAVAMYLRRRPADLTGIALRNKGTFPAERVYQTIDGRRTVKPHGESQMPIWGDAFAKSAAGNDERAIKEKIDAVVSYLESIQRGRVP